MKKLLLLLIAMATIGNAYATPPEFLGDKYRGWFFHEQAPEPEKKPKPEEKEAQPAPPAPTENPFSQAWFEKNLPILKDKAIDNPTKENVKAYLVAQKLWLDSASNFATAFTNVAIENPWLTEEKFRPTANFGSQFYDRQAASARKDLVKKISEKTGIWFFFQSICQICHVQAPVLRDLKDRLGVPVLAISTDGKGLPDFPKFVKDQGQAAQYNITTFPTLMIFRDNKLYPLSEGMMSSEQVIDRLLYYAKEYKWITEAEWNKAQPVDYNGVLKPEFIQNLTPEDAADPSAMVEKVRKQLIRQNTPR